MAIYIGKKVDRCLTYSSFIESRAFHCVTSGDNEAVIVTSQFRNKEVLGNKHIVTFQVHFYRPQRSWAKVIFSQACVKNSVHGGGGGCLPQCMLGYTPPRPGRHPPKPGRHPPKSRPPWTRQTPPQTRQTPPRPGRHPPRPGRHPPEQTPLDQVDTPPDQADPPGPGRPPPDQADTPPPEADSSIRSTSGRYASYWNAFLCYIIILFIYFEVSVLSVHIILFNYNNVIFIKINYTKLYFTKCISWPSFNWWVM